MQLHLESCIGNITGGEIFLIVSFFNVTYCVRGGGGGAGDVHWSFKILNVQEANSQNVMNCHLVKGACLY